MPTVMFSCGNMVIGKELFVYYAAAESVVGVAKIEFEKLLSTFHN